MSNVTLYQQSESLILAQENEFSTLAAIHGAVNFKREASYALQILKNNEFTLGVAIKNQDSLKHAILNVASIGLSLSPVHKLAYLVPRGGQVCLDISYQGLLKLATDSQAIMWAIADIVYQKDFYLFNGHGHEVTHKYDPFSKDRGPIIGAYCMAKDYNGEFHVAQMPIDEIYKIRDRSESFKRNSGPWKTDELEMIKKTLIRRGSKSWPKTNTKDDRFAKAITVFDETEQVDTSATPVAQIPEQTESKVNEVVSQIETLIIEKRRDRTKFIDFLGKTFRRKIENLSELSAFESARAISILKNLPLSEPEKEKEPTNETT